MLPEGCREKLLLFGCRFICSPRAADCLINVFTFGYHARPTPLFSYRESDLAAVSRGGVSLRKCCELQLIVCFKPAMLDNTSPNLAMCTVSNCVSSDCSACNDLVLSILTNTPNAQATRRCHICFQYYPSTGCLTFL